jgi:hypothetical protein
MRTIHAEIKDTTEIIVTPNEIICIEARPPVTADEIRMYGCVTERKPGPRVLLIAGICAFLAMVGLAELYFRVSGR